MFKAILSIFTALSTLILPQSTQVPETVTTDKVVVQKTPSPEVQADKTSAYNQASDKVINSVSQKAIENSDNLVPCTPESCPPQPNPTLQPVPTFRPAPQPIPIPLPVPIETAPPKPTSLPVPIEIAPPIVDEYPKPIEYPVLQELPKPEQKPIDKIDDEVPMPADEPSPRVDFGSVDY